MKPKSKPKDKPVSEMKEALAEIGPEQLADVLDSHEMDLVLASTFEDNEKESERK